MHEKNQFQMLTSEPGSFETFLYSCDQTFYLKVQLPNYPSYSGAVLHSCWKLKLLLQDAHVHESWLASIKNSQELIDFLTNKLGIKQRTSKNTTHSNVFYETIFDELNRIGSNAAINESFNFVDITTTDRCGREHKIKVKLPTTYPGERAIVDFHNLPINEEVTFNEKLDLRNARTLPQIHENFQNIVENFQPFWDAMDILDASCKIIEPIQPQFSDVTRRVKLTDNCSALLTFNPYNASQCPSIEFRGALPEVNHFRQVLAKNLLEDIWDPEVEIHINLLLLLELDTLPVGDANDSVPVEEAGLLRVGECGICFEDRLDGQAADQRCENDKCNSQYHQICLLKYLSTNVNSVRIMRNAIRGACPTCRKTIGCLNTIGYDYDSS